MIPHPRLADLPVSAFLSTSSSVLFFLVCVFTCVCVSAGLCVAAGLSGVSHKTVFQFRAPVGIGLLNDSDFGDCHAFCLPAMNLLALSFVQESENKRCGECGERL